MQNFIKPRHLANLFTQSFPSAGFLRINRTLREGNLMIPVKREEQGYTHNRNIRKPLLYRFNHAIHILLPLQKPKPLPKSDLHNNISCEPMQPRAQVKGSPFICQLFELSKEEGLSTIDQWFICLEIGHGVDLRNGALHHLVNRLILCGKDGGNNLPVSHVARHRIEV